MSSEAKCNCQHCNGHIAFPVELAGQMFACPHCKLETLLFIPPVATPPKLKNKRPALFVVIRFILVVVIIGVSVLIAKIATTKGREPSAQTPDPNLQEVNGALGWNLGDVLPNNLQVKIDDEIYGITYDFNPPAEMEDAQLSCHLVLTEDRRIAEIRVHGYENDHFNWEALKKVLKEKYGLRKSWKFPSDAPNYYYYFGQTNRQAVLQIEGQTSRIPSQIRLSYTDEQLYQLARQQQESRKAAANTQNQKTLNTLLKGKF